MTWHPLEPPTRRQVLAWMAGAGTAVLGPEVRADDASVLPDHVLIDLQVSAANAIAHRATLLVPRRAAPGAVLPVLILLHGLGETGSERMGAYAWVERYGLASCASRLMHPPVRSLSRQKYLRDERAEQINRELADRPFGDLVLVCPYVPNVYKASSPSGALDRYARWVTQELLPAVRERAPATSDPRRTGIDGCSLGGFVAFETFLRHPDHFYTCGGVQSAIGRGAVSSYANRLEKAVQGGMGHALHVETSLGDPFHDANVQLARELERRGVPVQLRVAPGPHDQPWLRDVGTLEMLLWHEAHLGGK